MLVWLVLLAGASLAMDVFVPDVDRENCDFGSVLAADGDYVIVGASGNTANITYVYRLGETDNGMEVLDSVGLHDDKYFEDVLFSRVNDYQSYLYGKAVDIKGDLAVVGAPGSYVFSDGYYNSSDSGTATSQNISNPDYVQNAGIVFVYEKNYNYTGTSTRDQPMFRGKFYLVEGESIPADELFGSYVKIFNERILIVGNDSGNLYVYDISDENVSKLENNRFLYDGYLDSDDTTTRVPYLTPLTTLECPSNEPCGSFGRSKILVYNDYLLVGDSSYKGSDGRSVGGIFVFKFVENYTDENNDSFTGFLYDHVIVNGLTNNSGSGFGSNFDIKKKEHGYDLVVGAPSTTLYMGSESSAGLVCYIELDEAFRPYNTYQRLVTSETLNKSVRYVVNVTPDLIYPPYPTAGDGFGENISITTYNGQTIVAISSSKKKVLDGRRGTVSFYKLVNSDFDAKKSAKRFEQLFTITENSGYNKDFINNHPEYLTTISGVGYASAMTIIGENLIVGATSFSYNVPSYDEEEETIEYTTITNGGVFVYNLRELFETSNVPELLLPISYFRDSVDYNVFVLFKDIDGDYLEENEVTSIVAPDLLFTCGTTSYNSPSLYFGFEKKGTSKISFDSSEITALVYNINVSGMSDIVCTFEIPNIGYDDASYYDYTLYVGEIVYSHIDDGIEYIKEESLDDSSSSSDTEDIVLISTSNSSNINSILISKFTGESYSLQYSMVNPIESMDIYMSPNNFKEDVDLTTDLLYSPPIPLYYKQLSIVSAINMDSESADSSNMTKKYSVYSVLLPDTNVESKYLVYNDSEDNYKANDIVRTFDYINIKGTGTDQSKYDLDNINLGSDVIINNKLISDYSFGSVVINDGPMYVIGTNTSTESLLLTKIDESQEYICDLMTGIRDYDSSEGNEVLSSYGVNSDNNIQVMYDEGIVAIGAKSADAVYFLDFSCNVVAKIERPAGTRTTTDGIYHYDLNTNEESNYVDASIYPHIALTSFGTAIKIVPLSEIEKSSENDYSGDYLMFVGAPTDLMIDVNYVLEDLSNLHLNVSEILNIICLGDVYIISISITKGANNNIIVTDNDSRSRSIKMIPCNTKYGDLSFGDKIEVDYRGIMISSSLKVNNSGTTDSESSSIPITIGSTTYYLPVADGAVELFILDDITFTNNMASDSSVLYHITNINLLSSFGLKSELARFGLKSEVISLDDSDTGSKFLYMITAQAASISYQSQGAVILCTGKITNIDSYDPNDAYTNVGAINYVGDKYAFNLKCDKLLTSKKRCSSCSYGSSISKACNDSNTTCLLVVGESTNSTYAANTDSGAAHYYKISVDQNTDDTNENGYEITLLGTKISTFANSSEKFGTGVGINILSEEDNNIYFSTVVGSPGTTTAYGYNSGLATVMRNINMSYSVELIGMNNRTVASGDLKNMATIWNGAKYKVLITNYDIFDNLEKPESINFTYKCFNMLNPDEETNCNIKFEKEDIESNSEYANTHIRYDLTVNSYDGGMCEIRISNPSKSSPEYIINLFPDASKSTFKVSKSTKQYSSVEDIYKAILNTSEYLNGDSGLSMELCVKSKDDEYISDYLDYDLLQFSTNCLIPSGDAFAPTYNGMSGKCYRFTSELPLLYDDICSVRVYSHYYNLDTELDLYVPSLSTTEIVLIIMGVLAAVLLASWVGIVIGCEGKQISEILSCARCCYADYEEVDGSDNSDFGESMIPSSNTISRSDAD